MSLDTTTGRYRCDRCGGDVGNGGPRESATIQDLSDDGLTPVRRDLCRTRPDPDRPGKKIKGCRDRVFTAAAFKDLRTRQKGTP